MTQEIFTTSAALALAAFFVFAPLVHAAEKSGPSAPASPVVASVGEEKITLEALNAFIENLPPRMRARALARKEAFLEALIQRVLMFRYARDNDFVKSARVQERLARVRREILIGEALSRIREGARPTPAEARAEYERNKANYTRGEKVDVAHIMVPTEKEAKEVLEKIDAGGDFAELAKKHSLAPERVRGGRLGVMGRGDSKKTGLPEIIEQTAFSLTAGAHSGVVRSVYGWHIVKITKKEPGEQLDFDQVRERIEKELGERRGMEALLEKFRALAARYGVKRYPENLK